MYELNYFQRLTNSWLLSIAYENVWWKYDKELGNAKSISAPLSVKYKEPKFKGNKCKEHFPEMRWAADVQQSK